MADRAPVIGLSGYHEEASWGAWTLDAGLVPWAYVRAIRDAGADVVILPPGGGPGLVRRVDALVLTGGADVDSRLYGEEPHPRNDVPRPERDDAELQLLEEALGLDLPVLGVCRGMQLMAVAHGGRLIQHLDDVVDGTAHLPQPGRYGAHEVRILPGSQLADVYGAARLHVPTYHHQAVAETGSLVPTAQTDDGIVEAVEDRGRRFVIGVQWHPEVARDRPLFKRLVSEAERAMTGTG